MPDTDTKIGFIGLGIMGAPMAANLARAGYPLVVNNRTRAKAEQFASSEGTDAAVAVVADTPKEVAERTDVVITMLPDSPDVEQVYLADDGVIAGVRAGQLLIDMSSIAPSVARAVSEAASGVGAAALDAPVSGGDVGAIYINGKYYGYVDELNNLGSGILLNPGTYDLHIDSPTFGDINQKLTIVANKTTMVPLPKKGKE